MNKPVKLSIQEVPVKLVEAFCNYCSQEKQCFRANYPSKFSQRKYELLGFKDFIEDWEYKTPFFGKSHKAIVGEIEREMVYKNNYEHEIVTEEVDICHECVEQLAKYSLKKKKSSKPKRGIR